MVYFSSFIWFTTSLVETVREYAIHVFLQIATEFFGFDPAAEALDDIAGDLYDALK